MILCPYIDSYSDETIYATARLLTGCSWLVPLTIPAGTTSFTPMNSFQADNMHRCSEAERRIRALDIALPGFRIHIVNTLRAKKDVMQDVERQRENREAVPRGASRFQSLSTSAQFLLDCASELRVVAHLVETDAERF